MDPKTKEPAKRKCCGTAKGAGPHEANCRVLMEKPKPESCTFSVLQAATRRLPNGAVFRAEYTAASETDGEWFGTLAVPRPPGDPKTGLKVFEAACGGVFGLMKKLDGKFRKWVSRDKAKGFATTSSDLTAAEGRS